MQHRTLGQTGLSLPILGFGASSLGQEFRSVELSDAIASVHTALDCGMNYIDTSPYYGRGASEVLLGFALRDVPRDSYILSTKLGRYAPQHFDFSAKRVRESIDVSLERMKVDHIDIMFCHDIEFVDMQQIVDETLPALRREQERGTIRFIGVSGYPMKMFKFILDQTDLDVVLSYNHYTLQNDMFADLIPYLKQKQVGAINAAPFSARLLTDAPLPVWHKATPFVRQVCSQAAAECAKAGTSLAKLALQYSVANPDMTSCVTGSANPARIREWAQWIEDPMDQQLLKRVKEILAPIHNWYYTEGRPENNDPVVDFRTV